MHEAAKHEAAYHEATLDPVAAARGRLESGKGPIRILMDVHGRTVPSRELGSGWIVRCHCVLVRSDGWSLGCTRELYEAAKQMFPRDWVALICYANTPHLTVIKLAR
jgi:hypothetical protein